MTPEHRLDPLLKPTSIALMGVSEKPDSAGQVLAQMVLESDYAGEVFLVNPAYQTIFRQPCYADLKSLPTTVDHVVIALGNQHLESSLQAVIEHGARAATIYANGMLEQDGEPDLSKRLQVRAQSAGVEICGINGMGFYNIGEQLYTGIFPRAERINKGGISYIAQSGSAFTTLCHNGCQLGFNLCVAAGNELVTTVADYMDWSLAQADTRVIALFLETVRDPAAFVAALSKANLNGIPVVILKIGKSPMAAKMALSHTGAIAGDHAVFQALCQRHGVILVDDFDEMAAILLLLQSGREALAGGFAAAFESGGLRELVSDQAQSLGIEFAPLDDASKAELKLNLDPGLEAENPLDAWGSPRRFEARFENCMRALMQDSNVAAGAFISNFRDGYYLSEAIFRSVERVSKVTDKPIVLATCYADLANTEICRRARDARIPLIAGVRETLLAFKHWFAYRDFKLQPAPIPAITLAPKTIKSWKQRLQNYRCEVLSETDALAFLADFSIAAVKHEAVSNQAELLSAAACLGYPLVLKTAQPGIHHKSDRNGVVVNIQNQADLVESYRDLRQRLGPRALVAQMVTASAEISLGIYNDPQFGPIIVAAAGGTLIELISDRAVALCPIDSTQAAAMIATLKVNRLLQGLRGKPAVKRRALLERMVTLSLLACEFDDYLAEIDINPVLTSPVAVLAADALVVLKKPPDPC